MNGDKERCNPPENSAEVERFQDPIIGLCLECGYRPPIVRSEGLAFLDRTTLSGRTYRYYETERANVAILVSYLL
jgi:hypothetical protein